jgi:hypothetical protein
LANDGHNLLNTNCYFFDPLGTWVSKLTEEGIDELVFVRWGHFAQNSSDPDQGLANLCPDLELSGTPSVHSVVGI